MTLTPNALNIMRSNAAVRDAINPGSVAHCPQHDRFTHECMHCAQAFYSQRQRQEAERRGEQ